jgi:tRNA dimethylallyltransferase
MERLRPVLVMGPTASGKSALAMALAERFPAEIVSVDSAQVYRGMDIGTAKPSPEERRRVPHHLVDVVDPDAAYSAARFREDALAAIEAIRVRGRVPLVVGGTMLYFRALREGLSDLPPADPRLRAEIAGVLAREGLPALRARLAALDPDSARRLAPGDSQRIQRALEVCLLAGRPMSSLVGRTGRDDRLGEHAAIALLPGDRTELHRRIEARFERMLADGLVDELRALRARYRLTATLPAMRCVGYRQAWDFLEGRADARELRAKGVAATRQLAKRQLTWLRQTRAEAFDCFAPDLHGQVARWLERAPG